MTCNRISILENVLENLPQGICMFDADGRVLAFNRQFTQIHGNSETFHEGMWIGEILRASSASGSFPGNPEQYVPVLMGAMKEGRTLRSEIEFGDGRIMLITNKPTGDGGWLTTQVEITDRVRAERQVAYMARHDLLTGLPNRAAFQDRLAIAIVEARAKLEKFAVLCVDFDHFKEINDSFGHAVGDAFLQEVARRLHVAAEGAFVARFGGDEFNLICCEGPQPASALALAGRLQTKVAGEVRIADHRMAAGLSVGVGIFPDAGPDFAALINNADRALYRAKAAGRGTTFLFEPAAGASLRNGRDLGSPRNVAPRKGDRRSVSLGLLNKAIPQGNRRGVVRTPV